METTVVSDEAGSVCAIECKWECPLEIVLGGILSAYLGASVKQAESVQSSV